MKNVKRMYRVELMISTGIAQEIALLACRSNGGKYISLTDMESIAKVEVIKFPFLNQDISVNRIGENHLTIDKGTENLLAITEVEILELVDEPSPTLHRYSNTGIMDSDNQELLN